MKDQETVARVIERGKLPRPWHFAGEEPTLAELQEAVGGYIELVPFPARPDMVMVVDEEGLIKRKLVNHVASSLAGQPIVGTALVIERRLLK